MTEIKAREEYASEMEHTFDVMARALKSGLEDIGFTEGTISVSEHGYCAIGKRENVKVQIDGRWDGQL